MNGTNGTATAVRADEGARCAYLVERLTRERLESGRPLPFGAWSPEEAAALFGPDDPDLRAGEQQWRRFRALVNTREAMPLDDGVLAVQDAMLRSVIAARGVVRAADVAPSAVDGRVGVWRGDITALAADAIVNAANSRMTGCWAPLHDCIDNSIHTLAGVQLRLECARHIERQGHPEPTGTATVTGAYNLPSGHVIHTVGPIAAGHPTDSHRERLASCYRSCLDAAAGIGARTVGLCCISTGTFGFPGDEAAGIAVRTVRGWLDAHRGFENGNPGHPGVVFVVFSERDEALYRSLLDR